MERYFSFSYFIDAIPKIASALPETLLVVFFALLAGLVLGFIFAAMRIKGGPVVSRIAAAYISFMRGAPLIVIMFLVYFGVPQAMGGMGFDTSSYPRFPLVVAGFALNVSGYLAENMRSAFLAVDYGQFEACDSIGMTRLQACIHIIFPQALTIALPNLGNTLIMLIKDTSLAFSLGVTDLMGKTVLINARNYSARQAELYIAVGLIYWLICLICEKLISIIEKRGDKSRRRDAEVAVK